jgi:hypothetical protein
MDLGAAPLNPVGHFGFGVAPPIAREAADRARAVEETAGVLSGVYEAGELERLREDWPE